MTNKFERIKPLVSIIIPSWFANNQDGKYGQDETFWFAQECLKKLIDITPKDKYELIIIDNGSTLNLDYEEVEGCNMSTKEYWSHADILIRNKINLGFAPSTNQGFNLARGEYTVCLNNDVIIYDPNWIDVMIKDLNTDVDPRVGVLMPALMKETGDAREALELKEVNVKSNYNALGVKAEFGSMWMIKNETLDMIRKLNKEELGEPTVFDENFLLGMGEDRKLWQQIRLLGMETYRTHKIRVFHQGNMTMTKVENRRDYTTKNREYLAEWKKKHNIKE